MPHDKPFLTVPQAAALLGEKPAAVYYRAVKYGHINGVPVVEKTPRLRVVSRAALERAIAGETTAADKPLPWDRT
jgi:hypothetical protein